MVYVSATSADSVLDDLPLPSVSFIHNIINYNIIALLHFKVKAPYCPYAIVGIGMRYVNEIVMGHPLANLTKSLLVVHRKIKAVNISQLDALLIQMEQPIYILVLDVGYPFVVKEIPNLGQVFLILFGRLVSYYLTHKQATLPYSERSQTLGNSSTLKDFL